MKKSLLLAAVATVAITGAAHAQSRQNIQVVGSSTVFPFSTAAAENFARAGQFPAPVVESTGTGGGMQLFCGGIGEQHPDITGASRAMKASEFELCQENGVTDITQVLIGYDGIVFANSASAEQLDVTKEQLFQALAAEVEVDGEIVPNPYETWSEIDPSLPETEIQVFGPPPTSGTRDAWVELVMEAACVEFPAIAALEESDEDRFEAVCATIREDGKYIESGENDNLIVQRLSNAPEAYGIFGFSFLDQNQDTLQGSMVEGVAPTFDAIADGSYSISRPLFFYVKNAHVGVIPGLAEFVAEYTSERAMGPEGYLVDRGLIPLPEEEAAEQRSIATNLTAMTGVRE
ncbi:substrate-binding domain-containing protein [Inquilinus sp. CAU 1745]|uniref:substrate-binding domain-containing protein n=1 Tax=Inquilinus sp. CAU 1745 TaxID=3140369 RepID=UPI00325BEB0C